MFILSDDQRAFQARARELAQSVIAPRAADIDRSEQYPWDNVAALKEAGFTGITVPQDLGGQGCSFVDCVLLIVEMAKVCGVTGRIAVECNMGAISAVMAYGDAAQRKMVAACVLSGDKPAICITEPNAGSAASEMTTRAQKKGGVYILNGKKHWITGGGVSRLHLIFARVYDEAGHEQGIGGFLALRDPDAGTPRGLIIGKREPTMGLRGIPETEIIFEDLEIEEAMMIVPPEGLRRGFAGLMNAYNSQRVGAAAVALGLAQGAYEKALAYSMEREQFGRPIYEFQGLQWMLADMSIQLAAAEALCYKAAGRAGDGFPDANEAAQAKIFTSEMAIKVTNDALQVFGAAGYSRNNPLERMVRDARMFTIGGGTAQILRTLVASRILKKKLPQSRDGYLNMPRAGA